MSTSASHPPAQHAALARLDSSNFTRFVTAATVTLVLFSQPACPHEPASLRTSLAAAAAMLPDPMSVRVAVSEAPELAAAAGIKMLPALRLYRTDEKPVAYRGPLAGRQGRCDSFDAGGGKCCRDSRGPR